MLFETRVFRGTQHRPQRRSQRAPAARKHRRHQLLAEPVPEQHFVVHERRGSGALGEQDEQVRGRRHQHGVELQELFFGLTKFLVIDNLQT